MKSVAYKIGSLVQWNWMNHKVKGTVEKIYLKPVSKIFRGTTYKRNGSPERPAYQVKSLAGNQVVKIHSELTSVGRRATSEISVARRASSGRTGRHK